MTREKLIGSIAAIAAIIGISYGTVKLSPPTTPTTPPVVKKPDSPPTQPEVDPNVAHLELAADHDKAGIGDLVTIKVANSNATTFSWQVYPETANFKVQTGGREAYLASGSTPQEYLVIVSGAKGETSEVKIIKIRFVENVPANPTDIAGKVQAWAAKVSSPKKRDEVLALSQGFLTLANSVAAGTVQPADLVKATAQSNRDAVGANLPNWETFLTSLGTELKAMATAGKLTDADSHIKTWRAIGEALKQYAQTL